MAMDRTTDTMILDGHILSNRDLEVFWAFHEVGTYVGAAKKCGVSKDVVKRIIDSPWAKRLFETKVKLRNESFMHRLQEKDDMALEAYEAIIKGERAHDKSTMAQAKLIEVRMKAGRNPILDTRNVTTNIHNEQKNTVVLTPEQMRGMTPEELIEVNRSGELPERLRKELEAPKPVEFPAELPGDLLAVRTMELKLKALGKNLEENKELEVSLEPDA